MTFTALWRFLAVALPVIAALMANLSTIDLAYHLRAGAMFLDSGRIPTVDTFSFTATGQPWLNQQWGAQALLAAVWRATGWTGLVILRAALVGAMAGLIYAACRRQGLAVRPAAWLTLAAFALSAVALALRPQLFGMVLFGLVLLIVVERRRRRVLLWAVPPIVALWANLHGSFFLAPVVLGVAWLADLHDGVPHANRTLIAAILSVVAAVANPFGPAVWVYAVGLTTNALVTERITEWQPTTLRTIPGIAFYVSALLVAAVLARRERALSWPALAWFAGFFIIGAWAIRGVAWWPAAAVVGIAGVLGTGFLGSGAPEAPVPAAAERPRRLNILVAAALVVAGVALLPPWRPLDVALGAPAGVVGDAPPGVTTAVRELAQPGDRLFAPQPWGSWFELSVPEATVPVDARIELFPADVWRDYETVAAGRPEWQAVLDRWGVDLIVATEDGEPGLLARLAEQGEWTRAYTDDDGAVFVRTAR